MTVSRTAFSGVLPDWQPSASGMIVFRHLRPLPAMFRRIAGLALPVFQAGRNGRDSTGRLHGLRIAGAARIAIAVVAGLLVPFDAGAETGVAPPLPARLLLLDGAVAGSRLIVVGERGYILFSFDDGASWGQAEVPVKVMLTGIHMHDALTGWAVGHDAVILRTVDGGETWSMVHEAPEEELPLLDVWFRDRAAGDLQ